MSGFVIEGRRIVHACAALVAVSPMLYGCGDNAESPSQTQTAHDKQPVIWYDGVASDAEFSQPELTNDQRREVFEEQDLFAHTDPVQADQPGYAWLRSYAQESTVIFVKTVDGWDGVSGTPNDLLRNRQEYNQKLLKWPRTLKEEKNLCDGQAYEYQPAPGICSGTLVDDDIVLTAAHCFTTDGLPPHTEFRAIFGHYNVTTDAQAEIECDTPAGENCEGNDIFHVRPILVGDRAADVDEDWAFVQLVDAAGNPRRATPRYRPVPIRDDMTPLALGTPLAKIGGPSGVPLKISVSKEVRGKNGVVGVTAKKYGTFFDVLKGDSGGGIYDASTFELAGVMSGGPFFTATLPSGATVSTDYIPNLYLNPGEMPCNVLGVCPMPAKKIADLALKGVTQHCEDGGTLYQETAVRVSVPLSHLCGVGTGVPPLAMYTLPAGYYSERLCGVLIGATGMNDTCAQAEKFELKIGHETTLAGDTRPFAHDVTPSCGDTQDAADVFYQFEVKQKVYIYADAFGPGNDYDTVLFLHRGCPSTGEVACNDDSVYCPSEGGNPQYRSQIGQALDPGTYYLGVSGYNGAGGHYAVHIQAVELSDVGVLLDKSALGTVQYITGDTSSASSSQMENPTCGRPGAKDYQVLYATCPDYAGGLFTASTIDPLTSWDTVLSFRQGSRPFAFCNDDMAEWNVRQSSLGLAYLMHANSGAGIRAFYVDGFSPSDAGSFGLSLFVP